MMKPRACLGYGSLRKVLAAAAVPAFLLILWYSNRIPALAFRVSAVEPDVAKWRTVEKSSTTTWLKPGELVVQELTLESRAYELRFFAQAKAPRPGDFVDCFLVSRSSGMVSGWNELPLETLSDDWGEISLAFESVEHRGGFFLVVWNRADGNGSLGLKMVNSAYEWKLPGQLWKGDEKGIAPEHSLGLWGLTIFEHVPFSDLVYRASQYSAVKGVAILLLVSLFFWLLGCFLFRWSRMTAGGRGMWIVLAIAVIVVAAGFILRRGPVQLRLIEEEDSSEAALRCERMLASFLLGQTIGVPTSFSMVTASIPGGFETTGRVSRVDLVSRGVKGWVGLDALPEGGWLFVDESERFPLEFGIRHERRENRTGAWMDVSARFPDEYLKRDSVHLGMVVQLGPGQYARSGETTLQLGERVPLTQEELVRMLGDVPSRPAKHPDAVPVCGDWRGEGVSGVGYYDRRSGDFLLYNADQSLYQRFKFGEHGEDNWPAAGDWDGDGGSGVGLYSPNRHSFIYAEPPFDDVEKLSLRMSDTDAKSDQWRPIAGDWDSDGRDTIGLFQLETKKFILFANDGSIAEEFYFGAAFHPFVPLAGDWSNEGGDRVGVFNVKYGDLIIQTIYGIQMKRLTEDGYPLSGGWKEGERGDTIILLTGLQKNPFTMLSGEE